jgi:hypothetical protein
VQGRFDAATKLAKQAIGQDIKLEYTGSAKPPKPSPPNIS